MKPIKSTPIRIGGSSYENDRANGKRIAELERMVAHARIEVAEVMANAEREIETMRAQATAWRLLVMEVIAAAWNMTDTDRERFAVPPIEMMEGWRSRPEIEAAVKAWWERITALGCKHCTGQPQECPWCGQRYDQTME